MVLSNSDPLFFSPGLSEHLWIDPRSLWHNFHSYPEPPATAGLAFLQPPSPKSPLGGPARMGEADRREAHGSRAAGPQVWGRGELEHRHGRWGPSIPTQPRPCKRHHNTV